MGKTDDYLKAVERAGGQGLIIPLKDQVARNALIPTLDAFVLPGSPADVAPSEYGAVDRGLSEPPDLPREETDRTIFNFPLYQHTPILPISSPRHSPPLLHTRTP